MSTGGTHERAHRGRSDDRRALPDDAGAVRRLRRDRRLAAGLLAGVGRRAGAGPAVGPRDRPGHPDGRRRQRLGPYRRQRGRQVDRHRLAHRLAGARRPVRRRARRRRGAGGGADAGREVRPAEAAAGGAVVLRGESSRFASTNFWGSRAITGVIGPDETETVVGFDGIPIGEAMRAVGLDPDALPGSSATTSAPSSSCTSSRDRSSSRRGCRSASSPRSPACATTSSS